MLCWQRLVCGVAKNVPARSGTDLKMRRAPVFWILAGEKPGRGSSGSGLHISFQAPTRASVDAFHATALRRGAEGCRAAWGKTALYVPFYGAFVLDLDGFKIEAVCRAPELA